MKRIVVALLIVALMGTLTACDFSERKYSKAVDMYNDGEYAEAQEIFFELGAYEDAKELEQACRFYIALDDENIEDILATYEGLSTYSDEYREALYNYAQDCMEDGAYDDALSCYRVLKSYEDSKTLRKSAALSLIEKYVTENGSRGERFNYVTTSVNFDDAVYEGFKFTNYSTTVTVAFFDDNDMMTVHMRDDYIMTGTSYSVDVSEGVFLHYEADEDEAVVSTENESDYNRYSGSDFTAVKEIMGTISVLEFSAGTEPAITDYTYDIGYGEEKKYDEETPQNFGKAVEDLLDEFAVTLDGMGIGVTLEDLGFVMYTVG